jgi:peptide/nickel transport system ATP-binding protein
MRAPADPLLELDAVSRYYRVRSRTIFGKRREVRAVDGVSVELSAGEALGLVGESGSGKSTIARLVLGLSEPSAGSVRVRGRSVSEWLARDARAFRRTVQLVSQDPVSALNPRRTVADSLHAPLRALTAQTACERGARIDAMLDRVELGSDMLERYPHQLSGGQAQRVTIARALLIRPDLVVLDEALSALDVTVQARTIELLCELRRTLGVAYLFISHDLPVVAALCERVVVMRAGRFVESGASADVFANPREKYTRTLLDAVPGLCV